MPGTYRTALVRKEQIARGTLAFYFEKPSGFHYRAGQFAEWRSPEGQAPPAAGERRELTFFSAPHEPELAFATRMRDGPFKNAFAVMPLGDTVEFEGPFGTFLLHEDGTRPAVMLTGGIGITPFRSMVIDAVRRKLPHKIFLFYANRAPEDAAFMEELNNVQRTTENFKLIMTVTGAGPSSTAWSGERGHFTAEMLARSLDLQENPLYYIAGPPRMTQSVWQMLVGSGVSRDDIRTEEFSGY